jgi:hypothetical protein
MSVHRTLLGGAGNALENRKLLNFWARFTISIANSITFLVLLYLLFFAEVQETSRDLINILTGAYVAVLAKSTDYWFREKKDHEHEEEMEASKGRYKLKKGK